MGRSSKPWLRKDTQVWYATDMLKSGVDPVTVAELMGHKDLKMLMEIYQHVADDDVYLRKQMKKRK